MSEKEDKQGCGCGDSDDAQKKPKAAEDMPGQQKRNEEYQREGEESTSLPSSTQSEKGLVDKSKTSEQSKKGNQK